MTDTPILTDPPSRWDLLQAFIGNIARPYAIISTATGATVSTIIIAVKSERLDLALAAIFITAVYAGVGALYGAKAWENAKTGRQAADVEVAKVQAGGGV